MLVPAESKPEGQQTEDWCFAVWVLVLLGHLVGAPLFEHPHSVHLLQDLLSRRLEIGAAIHAATPLAQPGLLLVLLRRQYGAAFRSRRRV